MTDNQSGGRERNARREPLAVLAIGVLALLLAVWFLTRPSEPQPQEPTPRPTTVDPTSPPASPSASPSEAASSSAPPVGPGAVGDYGCLTLAEATAAVERDGFDVGSVAYTLEGGPVTDDWLVSDQTPAPGEPSPAGAAVDLVLSSPFMVCPTP